jgi:hypothetical protein
MAALIDHPTTRRPNSADHLLLHVAYAGHQLSARL